MYKRTNIKEATESEEACLEESGNGYICTREKGHKGKHMAHVGKDEYSSDVKRKGWY